jgi:hypothetical protein
MVKQNNITNIIKFDGDLSPTMKRVLPIATQTLPSPDTPFGNQI